MGLRNPFRFAVDREDRRRLHGRLLARRQRRRPGARARRPRPLDGHPPGRQLRLAVLRDARTCPTSTTTSPTRRVRRGVQLRRADQRLAHNTGRRVLPPVVQPDVWYSYPAVDRTVPGAAQQRGGDGIGPMGGPAYDFDAENRSRVQWPRVFDGHAAVLRVDARLRQGRSAQPPNGGRWPSARSAAASSNRSWSSTTRWTWSSGPTARSTCSSTATASSPRTRRRSSSRIDFVRGGNHTPVVQVARRRHQPALPAAHRARSRARARPTPTATTLRYAWDFDADGTVDSRQPNPTYTYTAHGIFEATLRVTDTTGRSASARCGSSSATSAPVVDAHRDASRRRRSSSATP